MLCPALASHSTLSPPKLQTDALNCLCSLQDGGREELLPIIKTISPSAAGQFLMYPVLPIVKCFNNDFSDFQFQL